MTIYLFYKLVQLFYFIYLLWWEPRIYKPTTDFIPNFLNRLLHRLFVSVVYFTQNVLWVSNPLLHEVDLGALFIRNINWCDCQILNFIFFNANFSLLWVLCGTCLAFENPYHRLYIISILFYALVDLSKRGWYSFSFVKNYSRVQYVEIYLFYLELLRHDHIFIIMFIQIVIL